MTADGTGFNANEALTGPPTARSTAPASRDVDWNKHADHTPGHPSELQLRAMHSGSGPCGRQVHCDAAPSRQAAWDLVARDLTAAPFNMTLNDAFLVGNKVFYQGSGIIGSWHACTCPSDVRRLRRDQRVHGLARGRRRQREPGRRDAPHDGPVRGVQQAQHRLRDTHADRTAAARARQRRRPALSVAVGVNSLGLSWTAVPGATSYRVLRSEGFAGCDFGKAVIATVAGTSYTDPDVANARTYSYVVQPVGANAACAGPWQRVRAGGAADLRRLDHADPGSVQLQRSPAEHHAGGRRSGGHREPRPSRSAPTRRSGRKLGA